MYYVYILYSESFKRYYIGSTKDITLRLARHNAGHSPSTVAYRPWKLVYSESIDNFFKSDKEGTRNKGVEKPSIHGSSSRNKEIDWENVPMLSGR